MWQAMVRVSSHFLFPHLGHLVSRYLLCISQIQLCPSSPPPGHCGAFAYLISPGGGALANSVWPGGRAFTYPGAASELLTRMWFPILIQLSMEDFTGNTSRLADWVIFQGREKLVEVFSGMYSRFYPCISSL